MGPAGAADPARGTGVTTTPRSEHRFQTLLPALETVLHRPRDRIRAAGWRTSGSGLPGDCRIASKHGADYRPSGRARRCRYTSGATVAAAPTVRPMPRISAIAHRAIIVVRTLVHWRMPGGAVWRSCRAGGQRDRSDSGESDDRGHRTGRTRDSTPKRVPRPH
jgi:hypothetical protein